MRVAQGEFPQAAPPPQAPPGTTVIPQGDEIKS